MTVNLSNEPRHVTLPGAIPLPAPVHTVSTDVATVLNGATDGPNAPTISDTTSAIADVTLAPYSVTIIG